MAVFRASADLWLSMPNEAFSGAVTLYRPDVGSWQMFSALPRDPGKVLLRTFRLGDGSHRFLGLDGDHRLEAQDVAPDEAETFVLDPVPGREPEAIGITLHF